MPRTLFLVATPIGNLEDITLRALRVLRECSAVAAEDTRRTAKLLNHFNISTQMLSFHEHSGAGRIDELVARLKQGDDIALVSDAGTPLLSDPGFELVRSCLAAEIQVDPIPGASAPISAAVVSGFSLSRLLILGFAPYKSAARRKWLEDISARTDTVVFFESPHRIQETLSEMCAVLGTRQICVARELTKVHQEFIRGDSAAVLSKLPIPRGEFTVVVSNEIGLTTEHIQPDAGTVVATYHRATSGGLGRRAAISLAAKEFGLSSREVYALIESSRDMVIQHNEASSGEALKKLAD